MKAEITQDYNGFDIIVDAANPEFSRLTIDDLKKCENVSVLKKTDFGWEAKINGHSVFLQKRKDPHYGWVLDVV